MGANSLMPFHCQATSSPPVTCPLPCGHASLVCPHCCTNEKCCKCGYKPHYYKSYNPNCSVCEHPMSKCLTCSDMLQCHACLLRLTMTNKDQATPLPANLPDPSLIGRFPSLPADIPPLPIRTCHHCKHDMTSCHKCHAHSMCCNCSTSSEPAAMKTEPDDTIGNKLIANASIKSQSPFERTPLPQKDRSPIPLHHILRP
jgi:hypothetical protein